MDPFEVRMEYLELLKRLNASEQSIRRTVDFALKYAARCPDDIWDCVMTECAKAPANTRINILFMLNAFLADDYETNPTEVAVYRRLAVRDLPAIIDMVVPRDTWDAALNVTSTKQILQSWNTKRIFDSNLLASLLRTSEERAASVRERAHLGEMRDTTPISRTDVLRRIEEDRERHKRLRENGWVLPAMSFLYALEGSNTQIGSLINNDSIDVPILDFEQQWETTSDLNEDDHDYMREENSRWWGTETV
ncbi:hypothetical protein MYAM1_000833 [Malassezia yamatoensis]|uniref:CID domain-containing protein n=1 Tax=Malassezia yamatoensis TaxID=253288 RepID=A0AAJ6CGC0_9BASI|nr:hypothetical protein MYAM1_000833 [Malassezia yamatoensis]